MTLDHERQTPSHAGSKIKSVAKTIVAAATMMMNVSATRAPWLSALLCVDTFNQLRDLILHVSEGLGNGPHRYLLGRDRHQHGNQIVIRRGPRSKPCTQFSLVTIAGCHQLMHEKMRNLQYERIECNEIWSYVRKKQKKLKPGDSIRSDDFWTFVAIDPQPSLSLAT